MSRPLAILRADASTTIGTGHVVRCMALAEYLAAAGWRPVFAHSAESAAASPGGLARHERIVLDAADGAGEAAELLRRLGACDLLVVDHYGRDARFEAACRPWARRILALDDLADRPHDCTALLDPARDGADDAYRDLVPPDSALLFGPRYSPLRRQFQARLADGAARREEAADPRRVLISIGGIDAANMTCVALEAALKAAPRLAIDVVLGRAAPHLEAVRALAQQGGGVRVLSDVEDVAALMIEADIGIGAAGTSSWERCCLGLPSVVLPVVENQRRTAELLAAHNAALVLDAGARGAKRKITEAVKRLIGDRALRRGLAERAMTLSDGRGGWRVLLSLIDPLPARDGESVRLRLAERADTDLIYAWQTSPAVRRYSRNPEPPHANEHLAWMTASLANPDRVLTVILHGNAPVGVLRFDRQDDTPSYEVSILLKPSHHGRGVAAAALRLGQALLPGAVLRAEVHPENTDSQRLFRRCGYRPLDERHFLWSQAEARAAEAYAPREQIPEAAK